MVAGWNANHISRFICSMGTAWASSQQYPWEHGKYVGGIETVKVNIMLRIYSNQWHVYAGLAILNPAPVSKSINTLGARWRSFKLMLNLDEEGLRKRIYAARDKVFGPAQMRRPLLLSEDILDQFSLGRQSPPNNPSSPVIGAPASPPKPTVPGSSMLLTARLDGNRTTRYDRQLAPVPIGHGRLLGAARTSNRLSTSSSRPPRCSGCGSVSLKFSSGPNPVSTQQFIPPSTISPTVPTI
jgi:hypothetical protein